MPLKLDWKVNVNKDEVMRKIENAAPVKLIQFAQEIAGKAKRDHPYKDRSSNNTRSIGGGEFKPEFEVGKGQKGPAATKVKKLD